MGDEDLLEQMEHVGHAGHEGGSGGNPRIGKFIGITMAVQGVLMALCSALVGGARTELIASMVEHTNTALTYTAVSTKYRMLQAQLQQLHSLMPSDPKAFDALEQKSLQLEAAAGKTPVGDAIQVMRLESKMILSTVTPTRDDVQRFAQLVRKFDKERDAGKEWAESYEEAIKAHSLAAEHFEWAQLCAEIGIVIGSIALLLLNRRAWMLSVLLGCSAVTIIAFTYVARRTSLHEAEGKIAAAKASYARASSEEADRRADEQLLEDIEKVAR